MVYSNLFKSLKDMRAIQEAMAKKHKAVIQILDATDLEGLSDFPNKIWLDIYSFEKLANISNDLYDLDLKNLEKLDRLQEGIKDCSKLKKLVQSLKQQNVSIAARLNKDKAHIEKIIKRIASVIGEFRERCRSNMIEFLKNLDLDLRKILKPLVPSRVVDENVQFPKLNSDSMIIESLQSTMEKVDKDNEEDDDDLDDNAKLTAHVNMLVGTLEKVAKQLLLVVHETNRKYYEIVNPSQLFSEAPTPLAMPLPEYFTFENIGSHEVGLPKEPLTSQSIESLKNKVEKLLRRGSLTKQEAKSILDKIDNMILQSSNDLETVLKDMPNSKRENIVFQIIHSSVRGESRCSPRTERNEINIKTVKAIERDAFEKKPTTPNIRTENKRLFKPRSSVPAVPRQRKSSLPKATSVNRIKKDEVRAKTPTKPNRSKKMKKNVSRNNKSFLV